jgi:hypothetical protein
MGSVHCSILSSVLSGCRQNHAPLYLKADSDDEGSDEPDPRKIGTHSCVTMFIKMLLSLVRKIIN